MNNKNNSSKKYNTTVTKVRNRRKLSRKREKQEFQKYLKEEFLY